MGVSNEMFPDERGATGTNCILASAPNGITDAAVADRYEIHVWLLLK